MTVQCDICKKPFDSHDGGNLCSKCGQCFCPACEAERFDRDTDRCLSCLKLIAVPQLALST